LMVCERLGCQNDRSWPEADVLHAPANACFKTGSGHKTDAADSSIYEFTP
jgi:hypothetical protein